MRVIASILTISFLVGIVGYAAGIFTQEERQEYSCTLCRAIRYDGKTYGVRYTRVEDTAFTPWFRDNIDPSHGIHESRPHSWQHSKGDNTAAVFLMRPEVQATVMQRVPDRLTQAAILRSVNSPNRNANVRRVRKLVEYAHIDARGATWDRWWARNAPVFGLGEFRASSVAAP